MGKNSIVFISSGPWVENFWYFGTFYWQGCQNFVLGVQKRNMRRFFSWKYKFSHYFLPLSWALIVLCSFFHFFRRGFQDRLLCVSKNKVLRKKVLLGVFLNFFNVFGHEWKSFGLLANVFWKVIKTAFYVSLGRIWGKKFRKSNL